VARGEKLLERMREARFGWGQDDFRRLYRAYGFEVVEGARHIVVRHPEYPDPAYARTAVRLVDESLRRRGGAGGGE
jgi:hypothetical protein